MNTAPTIAGTNRALLAPSPAWIAASLALLALLALVPQAANAFRCGSKLVHEGDSRARVASICGEPTDVEQRSILRPPVIWRYGYRYVLPGDAIEVPVETWTYNLGPNKLMRRVRFEDGIVVEIETLGYGWWEDDSREARERRARR